MRHATLLAYAPIRSRVEKDTNKDGRPDEVTTSETSVQQSDALLNALSSAVAIAQMRDLLTEPSFPELLPISRSVRLGCLPPPDSAAFEAVTKLEGLVKKGEHEAVSEGHRAKQREFDLKIRQQEASARKDEAYFSCVRLKLQADSKVEDVIANCQKVIAEAAQK